MSQRFRRNVLRSLFLSVWAMVTLVLLAMVILLVREMASSGRDPLGALTPPDSGVEPAPQATPATSDRTTPTGSQRVELYFSSGDGLYLARESRTLPATESTVENCRTALNALIKGPETDVHSLLPPTVNVKALYLLPQGELVINFSRELQAEYSRASSATMESLLVQGLVHTLTQPALQNAMDPKVRKIRILVEDAPPSGTFPAHIDLNEPVATDPQWLPVRGQAG